MATSIHRVLANFRWRLQSITPTLVYPGAGRFRVYDPVKNPDPGQSSGWLRKFYVSWMDSLSDEAATDQDRREAWHVVQVHVIYPVIMPWDDLQDMMLQDRHDIIKALRSDANRVGWDATNPTTETGLYHRSRTGDECFRETTFWKLVTAWRCKVTESEQ